MCGDLGLGLVVVAETVEPLVRDDDARLFGVDCGIGKVLVMMSTRAWWGKRVLTAGLPSEHLVMAWNRVDFPTLARPTMPLLRLFPGRPRRTFSWVAAFFGGIFFLDAKERLAERLGGRRAIQMRRRTAGPRRTDVVKETEAGREKRQSKRW